MSSRNVALCDRLLQHENGWLPLARARRRATQDWRDDRGSRRPAPPTQASPCLDHSPDRTTDPKGCRRGRLCPRPGPSLRTSTLRNGRRSSKREPASPLARLVGVGRRRRRIRGRGLRRRSAFFSSSRGPDADHGADDGSGAGAGAVALRGLPRAFLGAGAGAGSPASTAFRGRPGLRLAGAAWRWAGASRGAAAAGPAAPPPPRAAPGAGPWRRAAARWRRRPGRPRAGRRCPTQAFGAGRTARRRQPS